MGQSRIERQRVEEARRRIADVDGVEPPVRDREQRRAVGRGGVGLVDGPPPGRWCRSSRRPAWRGPQSASSRRSRPGRAESRGRRGRRAGARSPSRVRRGAGRTSRRQRGQRGLRGLGGGSATAEPPSAATPRSAGTTSRATRRLKIILLCIRHEAATRHPPSRRWAVGVGVDVLVLAPVVIAAQPFELEAERLVEPERPLVPGKDVQLELEHARLARPGDGLLGGSARPIPRRRWAAAMIGPRSATCRLAGCWWRKESESAAAELTVRLRDEDSRVLVALQRPEIPPLLCGAAPAVRGQEPRAVLRSDRGAERDELGGVLEPPA